MTSEIIFDEVVACLYDGEYHLGIAALANSLVKFKFKGLINVGYRGGPLPGWVDQLKPIGDNYFYVTDDIVIHFKAVSTLMHLGYFKPYFIKDTFDSFPSAKKIFYFDADIIVQSPWKLFSRWLETGICLCLDISFHFIHHNHPWRKDWIKLAEADEGLLNNTHQYFNSGFIGVERNSQALIDRWINITNRYIKNGGETTAFCKDAFCSIKGDQDLLNAVITTSADIEINVMGKEAMGFTQPATLMMHAIGENKPWNTSQVMQLLKYGNRPGMAEKIFLDHCKFPINIFSNYNYRIKKMDLKSAAFLGRLIG